MHSSTTCRPSALVRLAHPGISAMVVVVMTAGLLTLVVGRAGAATTYIVQPGGACSDTGPGTTSTPLCTITAGARRAVAGDSVQVGAGTYREQVAVPSGVSLRASSRSAVVLGTDDYSGATWTLTGTATWSTTVPGTVTPTQVFLGDVLIAQVSGTPTAANTWSWDATTRSLTVRTSGPAPSGAEVTTRQYGFVLGTSTTGVTGATVDGFTLRRQGGAGVLLRSGTSASTVRNLSVTESGAYGISDQGGSGNVVTGVHTFGNASIGIRLSGATGDLVGSSTSDHNGFHGVSVQGGGSNTIRGVVANANKRPGTRVAAGIDVSLGAGGTTVERSTAFGNDDSGIEIYTGSSDAVVRRNLSYGNGDHGIDVSRSTGATVVSNTVADNAASGINVEGVSTATTIRDNIAADNTHDPSRSVGDIRVEAGSEPGTTLDRDLLYETSATGVLVEWQGVNYTTSGLGQFRAASGQELTGAAADPRFVGRSTGDLRLQGTSPAIDRADTSVAHWSSADLHGDGPVDDPKVTNVAGGSTADLGALEYRGAVAVPPTASPVSGTPTTYAIDARSSGTLGEAASAFLVDCGNGTVVTTRQASCSYQASGTYTVRVQVTGQVVGSTSYTDTATLALAARQDTPPDSPPVAALQLSASQVHQGVAVVASGSGSTDDHGIVEYRFNCGDGTADRVGTDSTSCVYAEVGTYTIALTVTDASGQVDTTGATVQVVTGTVVAPPSAPVARLTLSRHRVRRHKPVVADAGLSSSSPDTPIVAYRFRCGNGVRAGWTTSTRTVCRYRTAGRYVVRVKVRTSAGLTSVATRTVRVRR
jgi:parallel beta-helix repeat protein